MAVREDTKLASPHNWGACRYWWGLGCPRRWEEPPSKLVGCWGDRGGRRSGGQTGSAPLRLGR